LFRLDELQNVFLPGSEHMNILDERSDAATGKALSGADAALNGAEGNVAPREATVRLAERNLSDQLLVRPHSCGIASPSSVHAIG
jgi:hypothetical protein